MNIKKKRILFVVGIMILVCCVFAGSYAFWTVTKEQTDTNNLVTACLDLELIEETGAFGVNNAWPISDEEGLELEGYSFKVKNNCSETVNYIIGIDSLSIEGAAYLNDDSIKVSLDSGAPKVFGSLTDIERENVRGSKQVEIKSIEGNSANSHNIKLWIKSDAGVSEQSKQFKGQVFITGGQGISLPQKRIIASGDISKTEECVIETDGDKGDILNITNCHNVTGNSINYVLDESGVITITGSGMIKDFYDFNSVDNSLTTNGLIGEILDDMLLKKCEQNVVNCSQLNVSYRKNLLKLYTTEESIKTIFAEEELINSSETFASDEAAIISAYSLNILESSLTEIFDIIKEISASFPPIKEINIGDNINNISFGFLANDFANNLYSDTIVNFGNNINIIDNNAFYLADGILLNLNDNLNSIRSEYPFETFGTNSNSAIKISNFPKNIINFSNGLFVGVEFMDDVDLSNISEISTELFCHSKFHGKVTIGGSQIDDYAFERATFDDSVILLPSITYIHSSAFDNKTNNSNLTLKFVGPEKTITGINLSNYNVVWNYTE